MAKTKMLARRRTMGAATDSRTAFAGRGDLWQRQEPRHFNPHDPAHCDACFKAGERRIIAAVVDGLRQRGVLSPSINRPFVVRWKEPR